VTVYTSIVRLAQTLVVHVAHALAHTVLARLKVARMPHDVAEGAHVAQVALARKLQRPIIQVARAVLARTEIDARSLHVLVARIRLSQLLRQLELLRLQHSDLRRRIDLDPLSSFRPLFSLLLFTIIPNMAITLKKK
jgi:hypothetical protein